MENKKCKPFLKWVGGKTQILQQIIDKFPKNINTYKEIFLGGGSILIELLQNNNINIKEIKAYDFNKNLIFTYKTIKNNVDKLINKLQNIITEYKNIEKIKDTLRKPTTYEERLISKECYYYYIRNKYNKIINNNDIMIAVYFIFLNKTCFRGVHRIGPNGFNVPFGNYKNPNIICVDNIRKLSQLFKKVNFYHMDFRKSIIDNNIDNFIYMDPPYVPENKKSFTKYNVNGFNEKDHIELFKICNNIKCNFLMSNSNTLLVKNNMKKFKIEEIECKRSINSINPGSKVKEILILKK